MPTGDLPQGMYTPISQNISDSDSEEEIHIRQINHHAAAAAAATMANMNRYTDSCDLIRGARNETISDMSYGNNQYGHYYTSDGEDNNKAYDRSNHYHHNSDADNVAILNSSTKIKHGLTMSPLRKFCFIVSIFVCILTLVLFIWVIPCSDGQSCPAKTDRIQTHNWLRKYERLEMKGAINVVPGLRGRSKNLIFMYRGDTVLPGTTNNVKQNGIISLIGSAGQVAWYDQMADEPSVIDCSLIDVDKNGEYDCLVLDEAGHIGCLNPLSGQWYWHVADKTANNPVPLGFPLILPDIDRDGVRDLLVAYASGASDTYNTLKFISGATGQMIGRKYTVDKCSYINKFKLEQLDVKFNCINNETDQEMTMSLLELCNGAGITQATILATQWRNTPTISQHKFYGQRKDTLYQKNIYPLKGKRLIVENNGLCPDACNMTITLEEDVKNPQVYRNFTSTRMYGMVPSLLSFNNAEFNSKTPVNGFVLKFWEWGTNETFLMNGHKSSEQKPPTNSKEFNKFSNILRKKRAWNPVQPNSRHNKIETDTEKKSNMHQSSGGSDGGSKAGIGIVTSRMRLIKETVVLIIFNSTDIRIENTSQSNIIQFCVNDNRMELICQPDLNYQENSVLVADLDQDGSQELVSYYSTFVETEAEQNKWKLMTYVQLLRLESELPKLYAVDEKK